MRKFLALLLSLVMVLGLMTAAGAADTEETVAAAGTEEAAAAAGETALTASAAETEEWNVAEEDYYVQALVYLDLFNGYEHDDGSVDFAGTQYIERDEAATVITRLLFGGESTFEQYKANYADAEIYSDVSSANWAAGYVNYLSVVKDIIDGFPEGDYRPDESLTGYQLCKLLLATAGVSEDVLTGDDWDENIKFLVGKYDLLANFALEPNLERAVTRQDAALIIYNALNTLPIFDANSFVIESNGTITYTISEVEGENLLSKYYGIFVTGAYVGATGSALYELKEDDTAAVISPFLNKGNAIIAKGDESYKVGDVVTVLANVQTGAYYVDEEGYPYVFEDASVEADFALKYEEPANTVEFSETEIPASADALVSALTAAGFQNVVDYTTSTVDGKEVKTYNTFTYTLDVENSGSASAAGTGTLAEILALVGEGCVLSAEQSSEYTFNFADVQDGVITDWDRYLESYGTTYATVFHIGDTFHPYLASDKTIASYFDANETYAIDGSVVTEDGKVVSGEYYVFDTESYWTIVDPAVEAAYGSVTLMKYAARLDSKTGLIASAYDATAKNNGGKAVGSVTFDKDTYLVSDTYAAGLEKSGATVVLSYTDGSKKTLGYFAIEAEEIYWASHVFEEEGITVENKGVKVYLDLDGNIWKLEVLDPGAQFVQLDEGYAAILALDIEDGKYARRFIYGDYFNVPEYTALAMLFKGDTYAIGYYDLAVNLVYNDGYYKLAAIGDMLQKDTFDSGVYTATADDYCLFEVPLVSGAVKAEYEFIGDDTVYVWNYTDAAGNVIALYSEHDPAYILASATNLSDYFWYGYEFDKSAEEYDFIAPVSSQKGATIDLAAFNAQLEAGKLTASATLKLSKVWDVIWVGPREVDEEDVFSYYFSNDEKTEIYLRDNIDWAILYYDYYDYTGLLNLQPTITVGASSGSGLTVSLNDASLVYLQRVTENPADSTYYEITKDTRFVYLDLSDSDGDTFEYYVTDQSEVKGANGIAPGTQVMIETDAKDATKLTYVYILQAFVTTTNSYSSYAYLTGYKGVAANDGVNTYSFTGVDINGKEITAYGTSSDYSKLTNGTGLVALDGKNNIMAIGDAITDIYITGYNVDNGKNGSKYLTVDAVLANLDLKSIAQKLNNGGVLDLDAVNVKLNGAVLTGSGGTVDVTLEDELLYEYFGNLLDDYPFPETLAGLLEENPNYKLSSEFTLLDTTGAYWTDGQDVFYKSGASYIECGDPYHILYSAATLTPLTETYYYFNGQYYTLETAGITVTKNSVDTTTSYGFYVPVSSAGYYSSILVKNSDGAVVGFSASLKTLIDNGIIPVNYYVGSYSGGMPESSFNGAALYYYDLGKTTQAVYVHGSFNVADLSYTKLGSENNTQVQVSITDNVVLTASVSAYLTLDTVEFLSGAGKAGEETVDLTNYLTASNGEKTYYDTLDAGLYASATDYLYYNCVNGMLIKSYVSPSTLQRWLSDGSVVNAAIPAALEEIINSSAVTTALPASLLTPVKLANAALVKGGDGVYYTSVEAIKAYAIYGYMKELAGYDGFDWLLDPSAKTTDDVEKLQMAAAVEAYNKASGVMFTADYDVKTNSGGVELFLADAQGDPVSVAWTIPAEKDASGNITVAAKPYSYAVRLYANLANLTAAYTASDVGTATSSYDAQTVFRFKLVLDVNAIMDILEGSGVLSAQSEADALAQLLKTYLDAGDAVIKAFTNLELGYAAYFRIFK